LIDAEIIQKRLERLNQYVGLLEKLAEQPRARFLSDPFVRGNVERYLQLAIQICLDIGNHILTARAKVKIGGLAIEEHDRWGRYRTKG